MNRRNFFKTLSWAFLIPITFLSYLGINKDKKQKQNKETFIPADLIEKQSFFKGVIITKVNNQLQFFSNKCTHLGCSINQSEDGKYLCSCHGSQFDTNGIPLKGPANKPLKKLSYSFIPEKNGYLVIEKA